MIEQADKITAVLAYLLGLITGRGHIFENSQTIAIEFSHANEFANGIAHCLKCGDLATKKGDSLVCKNCSSKVDPKNRSTYNQPKLTTESLNSDIIPLLKKEFTARYEIIGNKSMTILVMSFDNKELFEKIKRFFGDSISYDAFHIPEEIKSAGKEIRIEYVNGLLDSAGFASPGGWLNRDGENMHGRMRVYFQIVRNWHLPVEIDNFLRKKFSLPIHTIDWGHPNIRDANMNDFYNNRPTTWSREHQIKFFPEYYTVFKFRIKSKQALFNELVDHNKKAIFKKTDDWFPPSQIRIKPYHPGESDIRIPEVARCHFDAFWQINAVMRCIFIKDLLSRVKNPECFLLTGKDKKENIKSLEKKLDKERKKLTEEIKKVHSKGIGREKSKIITKVEGFGSEKELYKPLALNLEKILKRKYKQDVRVVDSSASNLNFFLKNKNTELLRMFDYCEKFRIRPDIVGFLTKSRELIFEEVKITQLDLKALGQLLGYCFVAQPKEAILVSSKKPAISLIKVLKSRPDLLEYGFGKKVEIAYWHNNVMSIIKI